MKNSDLILLLAKSTKKFTSNQIENPYYRQIYLNTFEWAMDEVLDFYPREDKHISEQVALLTVHRIEIELNHYRKRHFWTPFPKEELLAIDQVIDILSSINTRFDYERP